MDYGRHIKLMWSDTNGFCNWTKTGIKVFFFNSIDVISTFRQQNSLFDQHSIKENLPYWGEKILGWKCQNIFLSPIAELLISHQMTFHPQFLEETNLKFDFKRTFISCSAAANENIAPNKLPAIQAALLLCPRTML